MAFLAFEGIDGAGKTGLIKAAAKALKARGLNLQQTREPGGTATGQKIRRILLEKSAAPPSPLTEILLYYADRSQNISQKIKPALKQGQWVLSDRYWAGTAAYQCGGRATGAAGERLAALLQQEICGTVQPDLWILLDIPLKEAERRLRLRFQKNTGRKGAVGKDRMEAEGLAFRRRTKNYYLKIARQNPEKWLILSGLLPEKELVSLILERLKKDKLITD